MAVTPEIVRQAERNVRGGDAYGKGWDDSNEFRHDRRDLGYEGSGWRGLSLIATVYGLSIIACVGMISYTDGWSNLRQPFTSYLLASGFILLGLVYPMFRRSVSVYRKAEAEFKKKWGRNPW